MMKLLLVFLILSLDKYGDCSAFINYLSDKIDYMTDYFSNVYKRVAHTIMDFITQKKTANRLAYFADRPMNGKIRHEFKDFKENIFYRDMDPTLSLTTPQMAQWHGRNMESHSVRTLDGYFLTIHRIVAGLNRQPNRTVLLHHGLLGSSTDWILLGPEKSLPYILSDAGYDVWLANARGNYYSRGHVSKRLDNPEFWNFSWQEIGEYDLSAVIDYIRNSKNMSETINFVGHSMGATALIVLLSLTPQYNQYLRVGVLLAPLAYMNNIQGPFKVLTSMSDAVVKQMGNGEFLPSRKVPSWLSHQYCKGLQSFCNNPLLFLSGIPENRYWNASFMASLMYHIPAGGSTNTILHYMQVAQNRRFHIFNRKSAEFNLSNVKVPIALISASDDLLAPVPDVLKLYFSIANPIDLYIIRDKKMTHTDFVLDYEAPQIVFEKILQYLEKGLEWNNLNLNGIPYDNTVYS